jgi:hypothetical protein
VNPGLITMLALAELVPLAALMLLLGLKTPPRLARPLVLGLVLAQRTLEDGSMYPALPASSFYPEIPILRRMQEDEGEPFRMIGLHYAFLPDAAALYRLEDLRGYEAMTLHRLVETFPLWSKGEWFNKVDDASRPFLSFLNVKYAIVSRDARLGEQWKPVMEDRGSRLLENIRALPRAFVPPRIRYEPEAASVVAAMTEARDFSEMAWILAPAQPPQEIANGPGRLKVRRDGAGFDIDATMQDAGWVVISESAWRGWHATIDGRPVPLHDANHAFLGVHVPTGQHHLRLVYMPTSFTHGRNVSLVTAAVLIVGLTLWRSRRRPTQGSR